MLVECGRVAPCGGNNQSTTFYVITNPDVLKGIVDIAEKEFTKMEIEEDMYGGLKTTLQTPKLDPKKGCPKKLWIPEIRLKDNL